MLARIVELSLVQRGMVCSLGFLLFFGGLYAFHALDIVAYPDPSPPMVELITQYPGWSVKKKLNARSRSPLKSRSTACRASRTFARCQSSG